MRAERRSDPRLTALAVLAIVLAVAVVLAPHAAGYFFLFDDFALVDAGMTTPFAKALSSPAGGFYRPAGIAAARLEAAFFGWRAPSGYAAVSVLLHALNAFLVFRILVRVGRRREAALLGAAVFLLSPWSGEAFFWVSSQFDLLAALFGLAALLVSLDGLEPVAASRPRVAAVTAAAFGLSLAACLSKEMAVTLPVLLLALAACRAATWETRVRSVAFLYAGAMGAASLLSLLLRSRVVGPLAGAYGSLPDLLRKAPLAANAWSDLRAIALPPGGAPAAFQAAWAVSLALLVAVAFVAFPRESAAAGTGLLLSLGPILWSGMAAGSTAGGRYLYFPGFWVAVLASTGVAGLLRGDAPAEGWRRAAPPLALALAGGLLAGGLVQTAHQRRLWRVAAGISRSTVEQVGRERGSAEFLHVRNLPASLAEGPFILKSYAFRLYFGAERMKVRSDAVVLSAATLPPTQVRGFPDPFSEYTFEGPGPAEKEISLDPGR